MRTARFLLISIVITLFTMLVIENGKEKESKKKRSARKVESAVKKDQAVPKKDTRIDIFDLMYAMMECESHYNDSAVNRRTNAVGCLQIRPIMVREVNRIQGKLGNTKMFTNNDRYSRPMSIAMFTIWYLYHHKNSSFEKVARCWNGGPDGYKKKSTVRYWEKVKSILYGDDKGYSY